MIGGMATSIYCVRSVDACLPTSTKFQLVQDFVDLRKVYAYSKLLFCNLDVVWLEHVEIFLGGGNFMKASHDCPGMFIILYQECDVILKLVKFKRLWRIWSMRQCMPVQQYIRFVQTYLYTKTDARKTTHTLQCTVIYTDIYICIYHRARCF